MVGYCEGVEGCFNFERRVNKEGDRRTPELGTSIGGRLLPGDGLSSQDNSIPVKKIPEFYTEFELPPEGTTVEDLYEEHHSYKWGEHRNCLAYKLDLLYQVLYIDHRETALGDPYAQFMHHRLNILDELLDTIPRLKLRKIPRNDR
jgi:hypothetical protein